MGQLTLNLWDNRIRHTIRPSISYNIMLPALINTMTNTLLIQKILENIQNSEGGYLDNPQE